MQKATMKSKHQSFDGDSIEWEKEQAKRMHGKSFIDRMITVFTSCFRDDDVAVMDKNAFGIVVNWPVGNKDWKDTSADVQATTGITRYRVSTSSSPFFDYFIEFSNSENYKYRFYDQTGDSYEVNTGRNGDHVVRFDSGKPTVLFITGS